LFSATPLPLDLLKAVDAKVDAKVESLVAGSVTLDHVSVAARLQDGLLSVEPISGVLAKGNFAGSAAMDSGGGGAAKVSLQFSKLDMNSLAQDFDMGDIVSGKVDVTANVAGRGDNPRDLVSSLNGTASVVMGKGQIKNSYADLLGADLLRFAAHGGPKDATSVNCLVGRFNIAKGLASTHDILFDTNEMTVKGEGAINLGAERLGLKFWPRPKEMSLINLAIPWRVEGPLQQPQVSLDETEVASRAAGALLSVINPLAVLVPMVTMGTGDKNPCLAALDAPQAADGKAAPAKKKKNSGGIHGFIDSVIPGR
jgi:uncharacterized protein involved in outer membrane biogenesis